MLLRMTRPWLVLCAALAACALQPEPPPPAVMLNGSLLPGGIGILTRRVPAGVVVAEVKEEGAAASAGVRAGDLVLRYNGAPVKSVRQFNRLMFESPPGSTVRLELERGGRVRQVEVPVRELDTMPHV